jgi:hypothetical protein
MTNAKVSAAVLTYGRLRPGSRLCTCAVLSKWVRYKRFSIASPNDISITRDVRTNQRRENATRDNCLAVDGNECAFLVFVRPVYVSSRKQTPPPPLTGSHVLLSSISERRRRARARHKHVLPRRSIRLRENLTPHQSIFRLPALLR